MKGSTIDTARKRPARGEPVGSSAWALDTIHLADSREFLPRLATNSVDLLIADIPYGIGLDEWDVLHANTNRALLGRSPAQQRSGSGFKRRGKPINGWSSDDFLIPYEYQQWCASWAAECLRILKPGASAFLFCGRRYLHRATIALEDAGFNVRDILAWHKPGAHHRAQRLSIVLERRGLNDQGEAWNGWRLGNLAPVFEPIMWFSKPYAYTVVDNVLEYGVGAMNPAAFEAYSGSRTNVITTWFASGEERLHEAQKPQRLIEALISLATQPEQVVLDPFAGACTTALASVHLGRHFICIESDVKYAEVGRQRLAQATAQMKLL